MRCVLNRTEGSELYTLGEIIVDGSCVVKTLELPWRDNKIGISCIPEGEYLVVRRASDKYGSHFHVTNVPGRSWILLHPANYVKQLRGCIAPGLDHGDIDGDGIIDVVKSVAAMNKLKTLLPDEFILNVGVLNC